MERNEQFQGIIAFHSDENGRFTRSENMDSYQKQY